MSEAQRAGTYPTTVFLKWLADNGFGVVCARGRGCRNLNSFARPDDRVDERLAQEWADAMGAKLSQIWPDGPETPPVPMGTPGRWPERPPPQDLGTARIVEASTLRPMRPAFSAPRAPGNDDDPLAFVRQQARASAARPLRIVPGSGLQQTEAVAPEGPRPPQGPAVPLEVPKPDVTLVPPLPEGPLPPAVPLPEAPAATGAGTPQARRAPLRRGYAPCPVCGKAKATKRSLPAHIRASHPSFDPAQPRAQVAPKALPYPCGSPGCERLFETVAGRDSHRRVAHGPVPFKCDDCSERFASQAALSDHKEGAHDGERCPIAGCKVRKPLGVAMRNHVRFGHGKDSDEVYGTPRYRSFGTGSLSAQSRGAPRDYPEVKIVSAEGTARTAGAMDLGPGISAEVDSALLPGTAELRDPVTGRVKARVSGLALDATAEMAAWIEAERARAQARLVEIAGEIAALRAQEQAGIKRLNALDRCTKALAELEEMEHA